MKLNRPNARVYYVTVKNTDTVLSILNQNLPQVTSSKKVIEAGGVWLNGKRIDSISTKITKGADLKVYVCPNQGYHYNFNPLSIVRECADWVVVVKEPLVTIAMDRSNQYFNLMAGLNRYYGFNNPSLGVQPITRLDYRVSGLCLFSKHKQAERRLFKQMQERRIKKRYLAIVNESNPPVKRIRIENKLQFKHKAMESNIGKIAKTHFILRDQNNAGYHMYYAMTKTGRRHQVRRHSASTIGPLVNDDMYSHQWQDRHATIGLIANQLRFFWNGEWINIVLHPDWESQLLAWLKAGSA